MRGREVRMGNKDEQRSFRKDTKRKTKTHGILYVSKKETPREVGRVDRDGFGKVGGKINGVGFGTGGW